jgi:hypothetical protein
MRTPQDMVEDMLSKGKSWIDILAVAATIREGKWKKDVETILIEKGIYPKDQIVRDAQLVAEIKKRKPPEKSKYHVIDKDALGLILGRMKTVQEKMEKPKVAPSTSPQLIPAEAMPKYVGPATPETDRLTNRMLNKPKTYKDDISKKISELNLEQLLKWALELGVPQEKLDKHKDKPLGLAKMGIGNMIRARSK